MSDGANVFRNPESCLVKKHIEITLHLIASNPANQCRDNKLICFLGQNADLTAAPLFPYHGFYIFAFNPFCNSTSISVLFQQNNVFWFNCHANIHCNFINNLDNVINVKNITPALIGL